MIPLFAYLQPQDATTGVPSQVTALDRPDVESLLVNTWPLPTWMTILLVAAFIALAIGLYLTERGTATTWQRALLATLRSSLFVLVLAMLASWAWQRFQTDRPELIIALDLSSSMNSPDDSPGGSPSQTRFADLLSRVTEDNARRLKTLSKSYRLKLIAIGEEARSLAVGTDEVIGKLSSLEASDRSSNLGNCLEQLLRMQRGRPTSACLLITDGINNNGPTIAEMAKRLSTNAIPLFIAGVGSEQSDPDLELTDVLIDPASFVGDSVQVPFSIRLNDVPPGQLTVTLRDQKSGETLASQNVVTNAGTSIANSRLSFIANRPGTIDLALEVSSLPNEKQIENNRFAKSIEIRDESIGVLLVQQSPSYEFRFLKHLLERTKQPGDPQKPAYRFSSVLLEGDPRYADQDSSAERLIPVSDEQLSNFDVILLGDVDLSILSSTALTAIDRWVTEKGGGLGVIASSQQNLERLGASSLGHLLPATIDRSTDTAGGLEELFRWTLTPIGNATPALQLDPDPIRSATIWSQLPKHQWIARVSKLKPGSQVWASHPSLKMPDQQPAPILASQFVGAGRVVLQGNDETYLWTSWYGNDLHYQRYWNQLVRWLARGKLSNSRDAQLALDRNPIPAGEEVAMTLRIPAGRSMLSSESSAEVIIESEQGRKTVLPLRRDSDAAELLRGSIHGLASGKYRAVVSRPTFTTPPAAEFTVLDAPGESSRTRSDFADLRLAAELTRGRFTPVNQLDQLLKQLPDGRAVRMQPLPSEPIWNHWLVCLLFISLITTEWLLRHRWEML